MWRLKSLVVLMVVATVLLMGTAVAQAWWGWWWNAEIAVEGVDVRTEWGANGPRDGFQAEIAVTLPTGAEAAIIGVAENESVTLSTSGALSCLSNGIEAQVLYRVQSIGTAGGSKVEVAVTVDGQTVGSAAGTLNEGIALNVLIPATNPDCS